MPKYRKRPVEPEIVEAEQFLPERKSWPKGVEKTTFSHEGGIYCKQCKNYLDRHAIIKTLEDKHIVCPYDWIITNAKGEKSVLTPDIFEQTYEKVEE